MLSQRKLEKIKDKLRTVSKNSRVYIGCDSSRKRRQGDGQRMANYSTAVVIHKIDENGIGRGCNLFITNEQEVDHDQNPSKPFQRMMNETYKVVEAYQQLEDVLKEHQVEIHLDLNDDKTQGSNCARNAAVGYVKGVTGIQPETKPESWAASHAADRGTRGGVDYG